MAVFYPSSFWKEQRQKSFPQTNWSFVLRNIPENMTGGFIPVFQNFQYFPKDIIILE